MTLVGSSQSNCTSVVFGFARIDVGHALAAIAPHLGTSSPETRNCTGKPTGGPFSRRDTRPRSPGKSSSNSAMQPRAQPLALGVALRATSTNCAKFDCCSCWSSGR